ncbi:MAG: hypothetical protein IKU43_00880 [Clostridia bacterium]|nr:hypothetical protein [Clostridia bacterium]
MANNIRTISDEEKMRSNYAEYLVRCKSAKTALMKVGIILGAIVIIALAFMLVLRWVAAAMLPIFVGTMALGWYLWRFTTLEYEYIIISATVEFHRIYGERSRKKIHEIKTSDIEKVAPLHAHPEVMDAEYAEIYDFSDGKHGEDCFYILYNGEKGKSIIYINVIKKTLDVFKYYKASAVEYGNIK